MLKTSSHRSAKHQQRLQAPLLCAAYPAAERLDQAMSSQMQPAGTAQTASGSGDAAGSTLSTKVPAVPVARVFLCAAHPRVRRDRFCPCASCSVIRRRFDPLLFPWKLFKKLAPTPKLSLSATNPLPAALARQNGPCPCPAAAPSADSTRTYK